MFRITRRSVLAGIAAGSGPALLRPGRGWAAAASPAPAPLAELTLWGPPAGPSITLVHAIASGLLRPVADKVVFKAWRTPDELRAGLTSGTMKTFVLPTQSAANLFNKGLGIRLVNVMTNGLLHLVSADPSLSSISALKGRTVALPFRNDTPEFVLRRLLAAGGLASDAAPGGEKAGGERAGGEKVALQFTGTPMEAIQLLVTGRADAALLPEPAASAAILRAGQAGRTVTRVIDIQQAWGAATGLGTDLPQAGLGVTGDFLAQHAPAVEALHAALAAATLSVNAGPARAANDAAAPLGLPWPVIEQAIPHSRLVCQRASAARNSLESLFRVVSEFDPRIIGGALPAADFYL
ncbi:ABC transporter substrate-binding protein [Azospirillum sp. YIM B02556]|uniref:ABC transporter substrate-binding protein n=1 Tax=Azospirillum endophyticum TaxID=2800326 RepID=A0ABS1EZU1_9PROT|nr:ABC transporter substrate-binding protein [Azospirillum endophyticum]MBK1836694.1 ABC transporter substrate-binding protein [Azospirillum endophyticum]